LFLLTVMVCSCLIIYIRFQTQLLYSLMANIIILRHLFFVVIISVGSNTVAAYTGNNYACLRHKRFTDNDRNQQTYGSYNVLLPWYSWKIAHLVLNYNHSLTKINVLGQKKLIVSFSGTAACSYSIYFFIFPLFL
jgi:hypothetical protein